MGGLLTSPRGVIGQRARCSRRSVLCPCIVWDCHSVSSFHEERAGGLEQAEQKGTRPTRIGGRPWSGARSAAGQSIGSHETALKPCLPSGVRWWKRMNLR